MPLAEDTGGGTPTSLCTPSPGDLATIVGNLIERQNNVERFLSRLVGADVNANNLAELAVDMGNLLNGTLTMQLSPNSPYGTGGSIPVPDGFNGTVISGNVITTWTDGVVSFQVTESGVVAGGGGGGSLDAALYSGTFIASVTSNTVSLSVIRDTDFCSLSSDTVTISQDGLYIINVAGNFSMSSTDDGTVSLTITTNGGNTYGANRHAFGTNSTINSRGYRLEVTWIGEVVVADGVNTFSVVLAKTDTAGTVVFFPYSPCVSVVRLGDL